MNANVWIADLTRPDKEWRFFARSATTQTKRPNISGGRTVEAVGKPVLFVVDDEPDSLAALRRELESRYGSHYEVAASGSAKDALARLSHLRAEDAAVPLVLADQWMSETSWSPDEQFHLAITESLAEWWRQRGGQFEVVTVIGADPGARSHELRDLLTRNSIPFGFYRSDSAQGRAALERLAVHRMAPGRRAPRSMGIPADRTGHRPALAPGAGTVPPGNQPARGVRGRRRAARVDQAGRLGRG